MGRCSAVFFQLGLPLSEFLMTRSKKEISLLLMAFFWICFKRFELSRASIIRVVIGDGEGDTDTPSRVMPDSALRLFKSG